MIFKMMSDVAVIDNGLTRGGYRFVDMESAMTGLKDNAEGALEYIYEHARKTVFYCAYFVLHDKGLAEDIMQETFIKVKQHAGSYCKGSKPMAWITTIARNLALNELNKRKRESSTDFNDNEFGNYEISDNNLILEQAFKCLNEVERQIVILHVLGGMKHRETADMLDMPLGTVLYKYSFALKKLKQAISKTAAEEVSVDEKR